ncbi:MAG: hypothetical protein B0D96_11355 [Candidatus Sedimenticola endophacoides]|nr:MAG: hypothetical protein B0D94_10165 [Candidatus Sedimenticola endophacoides]OQX33595.1 MAG: hypothetical protein B0D96_11355 [Candidatus Sedimenticola endophacoides]OQX34807.1 MAG: hypothetical protein B0D84_03110 [Candidatus Sedimenticola endophacoides]OQX38550.1 MAG: hypothetical protein B0D89_12525 [Candidatus Sedimenticola endophacoides]OQX39049.1 MAG: hypothetical protein B0D88_09700 [Candidatus Sedimenticola endophacoides]
MDTKSRLTLAEGRLLTQLADPEAPAPEPDTMLQHLIASQPGADPLATALPVDLAKAAQSEVRGGPKQWRALPRLIHAADAHAVLPIVARKLAAVGLCPELLPEPTQSLLHRHRQQHHIAIGQAMLLNHHASTIAEQFKKHKVDAIIVKGPRFASQLYDQPGDRTYTDIDFLVAPEAVNRANNLISQLGFSRPQKFWDNARRDQEYKWLLDENVSVLVEIHGNLVHYPALRRRVSLGYRELAAIGGVDPGNPVANLMIAVIHCACGHKFHRLNLLLDVLQAVRRLERKDDQVLTAAVSELGAELETGVTLGVVGTLFRCPRTLTLAEHFSHHWATRVGRKLISPDAVFAAPIPGSIDSRIRRHAFRRLQELGLARIG